MEEREMFPTGEDLDEEHNPKFDMDAIRSRTLIFSKKK